MRKKTRKDKKSRPQPKPNRQIPISLVRSLELNNQHHDLEQAREHPLLGCWIMTGWRESGLAPVVIAREQEPDKVMFGVYMVDLYCLGVKDAFTRTNYSLRQFERSLPKLCGGDPEKCSVELAHEVIYGAMEFADRFGFQPHPDFKGKMADLMLDPPGAHPRLDKVAFGKDGKPFYVSGPYEDEWKRAMIVNTLERTAGKGNYEYLVGLDGMPDFLDDEG